MAEPLAPPAGGRASPRLADDVPTDDRDARVTEGCRETDADLFERRPPVGRLDPAADPESRAGGCQRVDPFDVRRLEQPVVPGLLVGHVASDPVDDVGRPIDEIGRRKPDLLRDPRPASCQVGGHDHGRVRHGVDVAVEVAQRRPPERQILDRALDAGDLDHVALAVLVLHQDHRAVEVVLDQALGAESDGDADDAEAGHGGPDIDAEDAQDRQDGDRDDEGPDQRQAERVERGEAFLLLQRRQRPRAGELRLPFDDRHEDAVDEPPGNPERDEGDDDDQEDLEGDDGPGWQRRQGREVGHDARLAGGLRGVAVDGRHVRPGGSGFLSNDPGAHV